MEEGTDGGVKEEGMNSKRDWYGGRKGETDKGVEME